MSYRFAIRLIILILVAAMLGYMLIPKTTVHVYFYNLTDSKTPFTFQLLEDSTILLDTTTSNGFIGYVGSIKCSKGFHRYSIKSNAGKAELDPSFFFAQEHFLRLEKLDDGYLRTNSIKYHPYE